MRGQTKKVLFSLQFSMLKVRARAKTFTSTPPRTPKSGAIGAPKHGAREHEERMRQIFFAFGLFGAFEHEVQEFQNKPMGKKFTRPLGRAKKIALALQLLVLKASHVL